MASRSSGWRGRSRRSGWGRSSLFHVIRGAPIRRGRGRRRRLICHNRHRLAHLYGRRQWTAAGGREFSALTHRETRGASLPRDGDPPCASDSCSSPALWRSRSRHVTAVLRAIRVTNRRFGLGAYEDACPVPADPTRGAPTAVTPTRPGPAERAVGRRIAGLSNSAFTSLTQSISRRPMRDRRVRHGEPERRFQGSGGGLSPCVWSR